MKQIRLVVGDPVHMSHRTHQEVLANWNLQHPVDELQARMSNEHLETEWDPCVRGPGDAWWQRVKESVIVPQEDPPIQIPSHTQGVACPTCGVTCFDRASMFIHMSKAHKQDPRRSENLSISFDKSRDVKNGLHICRRCDKAMCDWSSLRKHIQESRCPALF